MDITLEEARNLEGYAQALQDMMWKLTGDNANSKSYDPMTVELGRRVIHSYAFDLKSGGRHHQFDEFESLDEVKSLMLEEATKWCQESRE